MFIQTAVFWQLLYSSYSSGLQ